MNIDREITEKVMGWFERDGYWFCKNSTVIPFYCWHPSTDIKQAFEVVDKMQELGFGFDLQINNTDDGYSAEFEKDTDPNNFNPMWHDTPAMAICLTALKAIKA